MIKFRKTAVVLLVSAFLFQGCATPVSKEAGKHFEETQKTVESLQQKEVPVVSDSAGAWLLGSRVKISKPLPDYFQTKSVVLTSMEGITLDTAVSKLSAQTGIPIRIEYDFRAGGAATGAAAPGGLPGMGGMPGGLPGMGGQITQLMYASNPALAAIKPFTINYGGTFKGALDEVASKAGMWWREDNGAVIFYRVETKVFQLPALPWVSTQTGAVGTSGAVGSGAGGATSTSSSNTGSSSNSSVTSASGSLNIDAWKAIDAGVKSVAGDAKVAVDGSLGTVAVTGTPAEVRRVQEYVENLSRSLRQQVSLDVKVYSVNVTREDNYGLDINAVFSNVAKSYGLALNTNNIPAISSASTAAKLGMSVLTTPNQNGNVSMWGGTQAVVQMLSSLGQVSLMNSQSAVTLNGQQVPLQVAKQIGYIASSSVTTTANVGATSTMTPGTVTVGFTGVMIPRVVGDRIYLGVNLTINSLMAMNTVTSNGSTIQLPNVSSSSFQQSAALKNGDTLVLTGFRQMAGQDKRNGVGSPYFFGLGGGMDATTDKTMLAIVITARIL